MCPLWFKGKYFCICHQFTSFELNICRWAHFLPLVCCRLSLCTFTCVFLQGSQVGTRTATQSPCCLPASHLWPLKGLWAFGEYVSVSPVPLLRDSRGSSLGLSGLLGHSFVIMTFDPCRPVCLEECRRCLPSLRLMVSRWLFCSLSFFFFQAFPCVFPEVGSA